MTNHTSDPLPVEQDADLRHQANTLGEEAALFLADRSAPCQWQRVIVCDFEYLYDTDAFKRYQVAEGDPTQGFVRWPFHRIVAGAWCMLTFSPDMDRPVVTNIEVISTAHASSWLCGGQMFARMTIDNHVSRLVRSDS